MSSFSRNSALNLIFNYSNIIFNLVTGVFLVPLYLRKISLDTYGSYLVSAGIAALIGLLEFGLSMVITQRLAKSHAQSDWPAFRQTTHTGIVAASLLFLVTCAVTVVTATQVPWLTRITPEHAHDLQVAFILQGATAGASIFLNLFGSVFQAMLKAGTLGAVNLISATVGVVTVVVTFSAHPSLTAIASGPLARAICAALLLLVNATHSLRKASLLPQAAPLGSALRLLRSCGPIFIGSVAKSVADNTQNLLLASAASPTAIAVLALTQKALQVCNMILAPIGSSIYSNLTQIKERSSAGYFASLLGIAIRSHFLLSAILVATASTFNYVFVSLWVGPDKFGGIVLSLLLGVATLITTRFAFFSFLIYSTGEFKRPLVLETSYSIMKILILFAIVRRWGMYAAPLADMTAGFVFLYGFSTRLMAPHVARSQFGSGIYYRGWSEFFVVAVAGYCVATWLEPHRSWPALAGLLLLFGFVALATALGFNAAFVRNALTFLRKKDLPSG